MFRSVLCDKFKHADAEVKRDQCHVMFLYFCLQSQCEVSAMFQRFVWKPIPMLHGTQ
jgi:hypothetical protein